MEIYNAELTVTMLSGAQIAWVGSVVAEPSEGGYVQPISRQSRPLLQVTFGTIEAEEVHTMFFNTDCGRKAFYYRPIPLTRFYEFTDVALGNATGAEETFQLQFTYGSIAWDALYVDNIVLYANGSEINESDWSEDDGLITLDADTGRTGQAITADYQVKFIMRFVESELSTGIETADFETIQTVTLREVF